MNALVSLETITDPQADIDKATRSAALILHVLANQVEPDPEDMLSVLENMKKRTTVVAIDTDSRVVSSGGFRPFEEEKGFIEDVATDGSLRGFGVGGAVISKLEDIARAESLKIMRVYPTVSAEHFYDGLGYIDVGTAYEKTL